ncbi:putative RNA-directed DNA polymerase from transposon X-element [Trichonephila clavipes]|nr:putative RNA-directed DNA polymerase from transposon X-element [Trichonephila clavipes]
MNEHLPVCVALQETLLKQSCTSNIRGYSILRKDCNTGERACGGVALLINHSTPFSPVLIRTSLQAVAVQVSIFSTVTICNVYLPPNVPLNFRELQELIDQLPSPFILLGDFNAHHMLWGCQDVNSRGKSAIDLSICSPSLLLNLTWSVLDNPLGSDHFPVVISYATPIACASIRQPRWKFDQADWETFRTQADITEDMVSSGSIDEAPSLHACKQWGLCQYHPDIANTLAETFAKTSSCDNYTPAFQALKRREGEGEVEFFSSSNEEGYNSPLTLRELRTALHRSGNTAAGPDGLHYIMLRHLSESSILSLLSLFNRIWETRVSHTVVSCPRFAVSKPGKDPTSAINYRPIALTSCLSKLMERMVSARLMFHLESHNLLSPLQSGFRNQDRPQTISFG